MNSSTTFPPSPLAASLRRRQFEASVAANLRICRDHYRLVLQLPVFPPTAPGHFVQVACNDLVDERTEPEIICWDDDDSGATPMPRLRGEELCQPTAVLRRPFSLAGREDTGNGVELHLIHRVVGIGTDWLARLRTGQTVRLIGPLGNLFTLPSTTGSAILVGGGVGIPPMLYLAQYLAGRSAVAFVGALSRDLLPFTIRDTVAATGSENVSPADRIEEFSRHRIQSVIATDDGSCGFRGFVTQALERHLDQIGLGADRMTDENFSAPRAPLPIIYTCGPEPMMKRVAEIALERGIPCQVAVERAMACGMGTCQSCVIKVKSDVPAATDGWLYKLACTDGPVFDATDLLW